MKGEEGRKTKTRCEERGDVSGGGEEDRKTRTNEMRNEEEESARERERVGGEIQG